MYLEKIKEPEDVKKLKLEELQPLADEVRKAVINRISKIGGHKGPNLGVVEMTVALHYVFNSPVDEIVFDVSHQCYPHKILTGRKEAYLDETKFSEVTGYTNPLESEHDFFKIGHTSTSVSLALGLAVARDLKQTKENIIAVIGDGSLSGGEALEALDYAGEYKNNLIVIVNDNDQSIAENHGGLYKNLRELRTMNGVSNNNFFKALGFEYHYLDNGHDIKKLVALFNVVKDTDHPVLLHIHTIKGKGLKYAEENRESWHSGGPFNVLDGSLKYPAVKDDTVFNSLKELLDTNPKAVVLNAGTPIGLGFVKKVREEYVNRGQFIDIGIAEENAVGMISGIAKNGGVPVFGTFAPFLQRVYDQVSHDLCLNDNPATILVINPGVYGMNSDTHIALCDIQEFSHIPNFTYLAPATKKEYNDALNFATSRSKHPVGIRVPAIWCELDNDNHNDFTKNMLVNNGNKVAIMAVGPMLKMALEVAKKVEEIFGKEITIINPINVSNLDYEILDELEEKHKLIITLEDGELQGGYGVNVASYFGQKNIKVMNFGISKKFHTDFKAEELLKSNGMSVENLVKIVEDYLQ